MRAPKLVAEHTPLICNGEAHACYALLRALLQLLPRDARMFCTFDTYCSQCDRTAMNDWALCEPQPMGVAENQPYLNVEARALTSNLQPETSFERWLCSLLARQQYEEIVRQSDLIYWFANLLDGGDRRRRRGRNRRFRSTSAT